jgi:hypothetical protein
VMKSPSLNARWPSIPPQQSSMATTTSRVSVRGNDFGHMFHSVRARTQMPKSPSEVRLSSHAMTASCLSSSDSCLGVLNV